MNETVHIDLTVTLYDATRAAIARISNVMAFVKVRSAALSCNRNA